MYMRLNCLEPHTHRERLFACIVASLAVPQPDKIDLSHRYRYCRYSGRYIGHVCLSIKASYARILKAFRPGTRDPRELSRALIVLATQLVGLM